MFVGDNSMPDPTDTDHVETTWGNPQYRPPER